MPAAPSAPAAAPASACLLVRRTLLLCRWDEHETPEDAVEVAPHLSIAQRRRDVLAHGVQRAFVPPRVQDVPLIGVLVDVEDRCDQTRGAHRAGGIAEARDELPALRVGVLAFRYPSTPRIATEVHVQLTTRRAGAGLLPDPAHQVAAVAAHLVDVVPAAPDRAVQRVRHPRGAVDGRTDPVCEPLPADERLRRTGDGSVAVVGDALRPRPAPTAGEDEHARREDPQTLHALH